MSTTTPTTSIKPAARSTSLQRLTSLGQAEWLQFRRNKTLLFMATVFPIGIPLLLFGISGNGATEAANAFDMFILYTLLFVQFYTVLSMATTRRDERVLKRLRTGEARDVEILGAICLPGAILTLVFSVVIFLALLLMGAPMPVNILSIIIALTLGLVISGALALLTSSFTRNAEASQLTSLPVFTLAFLGLSSIRPIFGDTIFADLVEYTPFAAISDLVHLGWAGNTFLDQVSEAGPLNFMGVFTESWQPTLILLVWTVGALYGAKRYVRWDSHR